MSNACAPRESERSRIKKLADMREQVRQLQLDLAKKDLISINNIEQVIELQRDRDRYLRLVRKIAKARTSELFALQRRAQKLVANE